MKLLCSKCGATGSIGCDCGVKYVRAGEYTARVVADPANARKSNRTIAKETGINERTVRRARSAATAAFAAPAAPDLVHEAIKANPGKSNRAIARELGVDESTVRRAKSATPAVKRVKKTPFQLAQESMPTAMKWPTREERGAPPLELENQPHPDHPGLTYRDVFIREHGFVQLFPLAEKRRHDNRTCTIEIMSGLRNISNVCHKQLKELKPLMTKISVAEFRSSLNEMKSKSYERELEAWQVLIPDLSSVFGFVTALLEEKKKCG